VKLKDAAEGLACNKKIILRNLQKKKHLRYYYQIVKLKDASEGLACNKKIIRNLQKKHLRL
jgi:hypothetical protein